MKNFKLLFCLFALIPFVSSCGSDDDDDVTFDKNKVEVVAGETVKVTIKRGEAPFTILSTESLVVNVSEKDRVITIEGVKPGNALITVTDKNKNTGNVVITVTKDPYQEVKADAKTRLVFGDVSKIEGTDKGVYSLTRENNVAKWSWVSEDENNTILLTFNTLIQGRATEPIKLDAKLVVDGKETKIDSLEIIQTEKGTVWVAFKVGDKEGICVGKLSK